MLKLGAGTFTTLIWFATSLAAEEADPQALARAIAQGLEAGPTTSTPFRLTVDCTDDKASRSLDLFPSGVATWNHRAQVSLTEATRIALLKALESRDFAHFAPRYGGRPEGPEEAALRVSCRIELEIAGLQKSSVQLVDGEQSQPFLALAAELLDLVEPIARADGLGADDLEDALGKLVAGQLTPEAFELRWVRLPGQGSRNSGSILRMEGGQLSRQAYTPGRELGEVLSRELDPDRLLELATAVHHAAFWTWPRNLWSETYIELEVRVLNYRYSVTARPFDGMSPTSLGEPQVHFDRLISLLGAHLGADELTDVVE